MDNLTHTLAGALVGEALARTLPCGTRMDAEQRRTLLISVSMVGSNLPDLDFLYSTLSGNKLDYLLHHRGHTHTVIGAMVTALFIIAACAWWWRRSRQIPARSDWLALALAALLAPLLHVAMDATNSYGVHPFWPVDNRWYFGDSIFIIEPLFWAAGASLFFVVTNTFGRIAIALLALAGPVLGALTGFVPTPILIGLTVVTAVLASMGKFVRSRTAVWVGIAFWVTMTCMFVAIHHVAVARAGEIAREHFPRMEMRDVVLTPMPANPWCWDALFIQTEGESYALRRATLSLASDALPAHRCPIRSSGAATFRFVKDPTPSTPRVLWRGVLYLSRQSLKDVSTQCEAAAALRFMRAPWLLNEDNRLIMGDARFDREVELSFAEIELSNPPQCPLYVPPWRPPREDLLQ